MKKRSLLFVPANSEKMIKKGIKSNSDIVIFDLEDAVAYSEKATARNLLFNLLDNVTIKSKFFIRVNDIKSEYFFEDIRVLKELEDVNWVLPKAESKEDILMLEKNLKKKKSNQKIIPIIETAKGLWNAYEIASSSDLVETLAFGAEDFTLDIGAKISESGNELKYARSQLVIVSRVANIEPPIDTVFTDFKNLDGLRQEARSISTLGFQGKLLIHPGQIDITNEEFSPTKEEFEKAKKIKKEFDKAQDKGVAAIEVDGQMVDYPIVKRAIKVLEMFEK